MSTDSLLAAAADVDPHRALTTFFVVTAVTAVVPILTRLLPGRPPQVVLLLVGGIVIGPSAAGLGHPEDIELLSDLGLGFLFLLAGYEIDPAVLQGKIGRRAITGWLISLVLACAAVFALYGAHFLRAPVPIAIGLTTTALGSLLPIMRDRGLTDRVFVCCITACGAVGELFPIVAIALVLGAYSSWFEVAAIIGICALGWLLVNLGRWLRGTALERVVVATAHGTAQTTLRWTILILVGLLLLTSSFGIDSVLGAFLAGFILRQWVGHDVETEFDRKLDSIGHGVFIPIFFVASGMNLDLKSILAEPTRLLIFFGLLLVVRGGPVLLVMRGILAARQRWQLLFLTATTLPLLVAVTDIGVRDGHMLRANAAALVGAGMLSVITGPMLGLNVLGPLTRPAHPDTVTPAPDPTTHHSPPPLPHGP